MDWRASPSLGNAVHGRDLRAREHEIDLEQRALTGKVIDYRERPEFAAVLQTVLDTIDAPPFVGRHGRRRELSGANIPSASMSEAISSRTIPGDLGALRGPRSAPSSVVVGRKYSVVSWICSGFAEGDVAIAA